MQLGKNVLVEAVMDDDSGRPYLSVAVKPVVRSHQLQHTECPQSGYTELELLCLRVLRAATRSPLPLPAPQLQPSSMILSLLSTD